MATTTEALNPAGLPVQRTSVPRDPAPGPGEPAARDSDAARAETREAHDGVDARRPDTEAAEVAPPTALRAGVSAPTAPGATTIARRPVRLDDASSTPTQPDAVPAGSRASPAAVAPAGAPAATPSRSTHSLAITDAATAVALRDAALTAAVAGTRLWADVAGLTAAVAATLELARFVRSCTESTHPDWRLLAAGLRASGAAVASSAAGLPAGADVTATTLPASLAEGETAPRTSQLAPGATTGRRLGAAVHSPSAEIRSETGRGADVPSFGAVPRTPAPAVPRPPSTLTAEPAVATQSPLRPHRSR